LLITYARCSAANKYQSARLTFNSDVYGTGTKYDDQTASGISSMLHGFIHGTTNYYAYGNATYTYIFNYASTSVWKFAEARYILNDSTTGPAFAAGMALGYWKDTSAISTIKLQFDSGNFSSGTMVTLYGI
jgi:hypothetical protein